MLPLVREEIRLMPHIMKMERFGVNLDYDALKEDTNYYYEKMDELDEFIQDHLKTRFDIDSSEELADAIQKTYPNANFNYTEKTHKRSVAKESLLQALNGIPELLGPILMRNAVATCLRTFMRPWMVQYEKHGRLYIQWNQFRNYTDTGARTGRLSSSPNLQNIPVEWEQLLRELKKAKYVLPFSLPSVRRYIVPDPGKILIGRDYSGQELRLLAHFSNGKLLEELREQPNRDLHRTAAELAGITRNEAKTLAFAIIYGAGTARVAESLDISIPEAEDIKARYLNTFTEIKKFTGEVMATAKFIGGMVKVPTLGGREYTSEHVQLAYRLVNYKIQGSAADQTKRAMLDFCDFADEDEDLLLSVHDQLVIQAPIEKQDAAAEKLEVAMNGSYQNVLRYKIVSDESRGLNFAEL